ncbi:MAG: Zn-ribbon domain-containing OB-fold protein [Methanobacteriota archaeon]|nr:MAG: Zn-ribbon domain-containing OB-fold protein [Euryarchaeota archaeon]
MATAPRFWRENPSRYNMVGFKCNSCGRYNFPPRTICPVCRRKSVGRIEPVKLKGTGKIFSLTETHEGMDTQNVQKPYVVAMVELDEGAMVTGQVIDCDASELRIGTKVRIALRKLSEEGTAGVIHYGYKFTLVRDGPDGPGDE